MTKARAGRPRVRLFVALDLPEAFCEVLDVWRLSTYERLEAFRTPAISNLHITLIFLGYQYERDLERLTELVLTRPPGPFELQATEVVALPPRRPRLHAVDLAERSGALVAWQDELSRRLADAGFYKSEKRPFWPHLTIARVKRGREREAAEADLPKLPASLRAPFMAERVTLYRSQLRRSGAVYEPLAGVRLT